MMVSNLGARAPFALILMACSVAAQPRMSIGPSVEQTIDRIGVRSVTLVIPRPVRIAADLVIPANIDLQFLPQGRLVIENGVHLTILGGVSAPASQFIFEIEMESSELRAPQLAVLSPQWFGATADDGTNDTRSLRLTGRFINLANGGTIEFTPGTYIVGRQTLSGAFGTGCAWCFETVLSIEANTGPVSLNGNGAVLRAADGLRLGSFDPVTGARFDPPRLPFTDLDYQSHAYFGMIQLRNNSGHVAIQDFELDGNLFGLELGGEWGDAGRQSAAYGIWAFGNDSVEINRVHTHHHGLDGLVVGYPGLAPTDSPTPHRLRQVDSEYNARQGMSWVGGIGLHATDCEFNHTGKARFSSPPGAGLDIEAENSIVRDGLFEDSEFIDNQGAGMIADSGDGGYSTFRRSVFWGTTNFSIWPNKPRLRFEDCTVYGTMVRAFPAVDPADAVVFQNCHFEDVPYPGAGVFVRPAGLIEMDAENLLIIDSTIIANTGRAMFLDGIGSREILRDVIIEHRYDGLQNSSFQSLFRGTELDGVRILENFAQPGDRTWYVQGELVNCLDLFIEGPRARWLNPISGTTGQICGP